MILYKYLQPARIDILEKEKIRFTQASCFNDPFELLIYIESFTSVGIFDKFKNLAKKNAKDINPIFFEENFEKLANIFTKPLANLNINFSEMLKQQFDKKNGVLSLTKNSKNLLMWAHYAKDHTGFLIGFNDNLWKLDLAKAFNFSYKELFKVEYSKTRPKYNSLINESFLNNEDDFFDNNNLDKFYKTILTTKSIHWKYEQEYRIIADLTNFESNIKDDNGFEIYFYSLPTNTISSIILGVNIIPEVKNKILSLMNENRYSHVKIFETELDMVEYKLKHKRIK